MKTRRSFLCGLFALPVAFLPKATRGKTITVRYVVDMQPAIEELNRITLKLDRQQMADFLKGSKVITGSAIRFPKSI